MEEFLSVESQLFLDHQRSLAATAGERLIHFGEKYWGICGEGLDEKEQQYRIEKKQRGRDFSRRDFEKLVREDRATLDEKSEAFMRNRLSFVRKQVVNVVGSHVPDLDKSDIYDRLRLFSVHLVDRRTISGYGCIRPSDGSICIAENSDPRVIDSTLSHEFFHALMGGYVVQNDSGISFKQWFGDHMLYEGFAYEAERFIQGSRHDGTDPHPEWRKQADEWLREFDRGATYKWLTTDLDPNDEVLLLEGTSAFEREMLARSYDYVC